MKGVRGEWRLDKTQNFLMQRFALAGTGTEQLILSPLCIFDACL
jgi:hypothetical protein